MEESNTNINKERRRKKQSDIINEKFKRRKNGNISYIWEQIQRFHSDQGDFKLKDLEFYVRNEVGDNHPEMENEEIEMIVKSLLKDGGVYTKQSRERDRITSDLAEHKVDEAITLLMDGHPGLLVQGLKCTGNRRKGTFDHLRPIVGDIAPNCKTDCGEGGHSNECFDMEADIILLYPGADGKLHIVIIEVKRPVNSEKPTDNIIDDAMVQLRKDRKFILTLLNDISIDYIDIQTLIAFPDTESFANNVTELSEVLLTKDDLCKPTLSKKLKINWIIDTQIENQLFLTACARLIGRGNRSINSKVQTDWMINYEDNVEKQLIMLNEEQREILHNLFLYSSVKNFSFAGGPGTGKSILALRCINILVKRYVEDGEGIENIFVYAVTCQRRPRPNPKPSQNLDLINYFKNNILMLDRVICICSTFREICRNLDIEDKDFKCAKMPEKVNLLSKKLKMNHKGQPVILFLDEISAFGTETLDWSSVSPPGCFLDKSSPGETLNLILAFNPIAQSQKHKIKVTLPEDNQKGFISKELYLRYRNTEKIQKITKFIGDTMNIYYQTDKKEIFGAGLSGVFPVWIDLGCEDLLDTKLLAAIKQIISRGKMIPQSELRVLYDGGVSQSILSFLENDDDLRNKVKFENEKDFRGCECTGVIYIGAGHLEAFTRAEQMLAIVTYSNSPPHNWYKKYVDALGKCVDEQLLSKLPLTIPNL